MKETTKVKNIEINHKWCKGCYICLVVCPQEVFTKDKELTKRGFLPVIIEKPDSCTGCLLCELMCPDLAITVSLWINSKI